MKPFAGRHGLALCCLLAGCATGSATPVIELRFWAMGAEGEVVQRLVGDFERENPGIRVRVQQIPWTAAHEKLLTSHVGDASPDVAQLGNTWVPEFAELHALEPLGPYVTRSTTVAPGDFFGGIWETNVIDGTPYGIPWYVDTRCIFYRTDLLADAGYASPPATWDEWREAMRRIVERGRGARHAILLPINEWAQPAILGFAAGAPLLSSDGVRGNFRDPRFRKAFAFYVSLFRDGFAPNVSMVQVANLYQDFAAGNFAMYISGPWNIGEFSRRIPPAMKNVWATMPMPAAAGAPPGASLAGGSSLVVFRSSRHKGEAWKLVEFLARPPVQARFYTLTGDLPARTAAWEDSALAGNRYARAFLVQLGNVHPAPKVPEWESIADKIAAQAEAAVRGGVSVDDALASLDADVDQILEKRRWIMAQRARPTAASTER